MRRSIVFLLISIFALSVSGQNAGFDLSNYGVRIEPDKRLIVVLGALEMATVKNAAGADEKLLNTPLSENGKKFRERLLSDNASLDPDLRRRIATFILQYKKNRPQLSDADLIAPFISMAYTLTPVPDMADPAVVSD